MVVICIITSFRNCLALPKSLFFSGEASCSNDDSSSEDGFVTTIHAETVARNFLFRNTTNTNNFEFPGFSVPENSGSSNGTYTQLFGISSARGTAHSGNSPDNFYDTACSHLKAPEPQKVNNSVPLSACGGSGEDDEFGKKIPTPCSGNLPQSEAPKKSLKIILSRLPRSSPVNNSGFQFVPVDFPPPGSVVVNPQPVPMPVPEPIVVPQPIFVAQNPDNFSSDSESDVSTSDYSTDIETLSDRNITDDESQWESDWFSDESVHDFDADYNPKHK